VEKYTAKVDAEKAVKEKRSNAKKKEPETEPS